MNRHAPCCWMAGLALAGVMTVGGCTSHRVTVDPVEVRPIHMTVDINIKIDRELDRFFDFEDEVPVDHGARASSTGSPAGSPKTEGAQP
ncbi:MAG: hypothetical protein WD534_17095 [Phycisphaeraceae bacterium]